MRAPRWRRDRAPMYELSTMQAIARRRARVAARRLSDKILVTFRRRSGEIFQHSQSDAQSLGDIRRRAFDARRCDSQRSGAFRAIFFDVPKCDSQRLGAARATFFDARRCDSQCSGENFRRSHKRIAIVGRLSDEVSHLLLARLVNLLRAWREDPSKANTRAQRVREPTKKQACPRRASQNSF